MMSVSSVLAVNIKMGMPLVSGSPLRATVTSRPVQATRFAGVDSASYDFTQFAIIERNALGSVAAILSDILTRAGYAAGDFDVSALANSLIQGYVVQEPMSARNAIGPLQSYAPFDLIETGEGQPNPEEH